MGGGALGTGVTIKSDRSGPSYELTTDGSGLSGTFESAFTQADRDTSVSGEAYARNTASGFTEKLSIAGVAGQNSAQLEYIRIASLLAEVSDGSTTSQTCVIGVPTQSADLPKSSVSYDGLQIFGEARVSQVTNTATVETYTISASVLSLTYNPDTDTVAFTLDLKGRLSNRSGTSQTVVDFGTYSGSATFDGSKLGFVDRLRSAYGPAALFGGGFFGPQAQTAAVSVGFEDLNRPDGRNVSLGALFILKKQ